MTRPTGLDAKGSHAMVRNIIIAGLAMGVVGVGALWGASYWMEPSWQYGDRSLRNNRQQITIRFSRGKWIIRAERRDQWKPTSVTSHCGFIRDDIAPKKILLPGVRFGLLHSVRVQGFEPQDQSAYRRAGNSGLRVNPARAVRNNRQTPGPATDDGSKFYRVYSESSGFLTENTAPSRILILWVSLWVPLVLLVIYPCFALMRGPVLRLRRRRNGLCTRCGYNLTGNTSGICPECAEPRRSGRPTRHQHGAEKAGR